MREAILLSSFLLFAACASPPPSYPPPPQKKSLDATGPGGLRHFVAFSDPAAPTYIVRDIDPAGDPGGWRWAWRHPELRFYLATTRALSFRAYLILPGRILREVGPVTVAVRVNGHAAGQARYDQPGEHRFEVSVPEGFLVAGINTVSIDPDRAWLAEGAGQPLSFLIARAGFVE